MYSKNRFSASNSLFNKKQESPSIRSVSSAGWSLFANSATSILFTFSFLCPMLIILGPTGPAAATEITKHVCGQCESIQVVCYTVAISHFFEMPSFSWE